MQINFFEKIETKVKIQEKAIRMVDLNGKKHNQVMVEVNFAPGKSITEKDLKATTFLITWDDGSQGRYQLVDMFRFTLADYYGCLTYPSHGMDFFDFYNWFKEQHPEVGSDTRMAAYYYRKVSD